MNFKRPAVEGGKKSLRTAGALAALKLSHVPRWNLSPADVPMAVEGQSATAAGVAATGLAQVFAVPVRPIDRGDADPAVGFTDGGDAGRTGVGVARNGQRSHGGGDAQDQTQEGGSHRTLSFFLAPLFPTGERCT